MDMQTDGDGGWNTGCREDFLRYYAAHSLDAQAIARFEGIQSTMLRLLRGRENEQLDVADIGCGAGTQARMWASKGHRVHGLDVNAPLLALARKRATASGLNINFVVASATSLPWADASMDVCLLPELLEHVEDWKQVLAECMRVLRPGGLLYVSTTNVLCPVQEEFRIPFYAWFPSAAKRRIEHLARTRWPALAGGTHYPAVNWFSYASLERHLSADGHACMDRFDLAGSVGDSVLKRTILSLVRGLPLLRLCAHVLTPYTVLVASKALVATVAASK